MEKLALALIIAARKLRPYFQSHKIVVLTNQSLRKAMNKPDAAGRLIQWAVELSEFDIEYCPRQAIKAQALADFIAEFTVAEEEPQEEEPDKKWEVKIDGSSIKGAGGVGVVFKTPEGHLLKHSVRLQYPTTNNEAEYEALLTSMRIARELGETMLRIQSNSQLIMGQVNGEYEAKEDRMAKYLKLVKKAIDCFDEVILVQVPCEQNTGADTLAKLASSDEATHQHIEVQYSPSHMEEEVSPIDVSSSWMIPITNYLEEGTLPSDPVEARKLKVRLARFTLIQGTLYKRGFSLPYLRCLDKTEADYVMREVHEGICGNHSGARSLVHKLVRAGYYWPTMQKDAISYTRACDRCQRFGNLIHSPPETLNPMTAPWPFAQ
jgi:ribonuclease HI